MVDRDYLLYEDYDIAELNGIDRKTANNRVEYLGWSVKKAITTPIKRTTPFAPIWKQWQEVAHSNGIGRETMRQRMRKLGMSAEEAASTPLRQKISRWTPEQHELMQRNGLTANLVNTRINELGWSEAKALNTPKLSEEERAKRASVGMRRYQERRKQDESN